MYEKCVILCLAGIAIQAQRNTKWISAFLCAPIMLSTWLRYKNGFGFLNWLSSPMVSSRLTYEINYWHFHEVMRSRKTTAYSWDHQACDQAPSHFFVQLITWSCIFWLGVWKPCIDTSAEAVKIIYYTSTGLRSLNIWLSASHSPSTMLETLLKN